MTILSNLLRKLITPHFLAFLSSNWWRIHNYIKKKLDKWQSFQSNLCSQLSLTSKSFTFSFPAQYELIKILLTIYKNSLLRWRSNVYHIEKKVGYYFFIITIWSKILITLEDCDNWFHQKSTRTSTRYIRTGIQKMLRIGMKWFLSYIIHIESNVTKVLISRMQREIVIFDTYLKNLKTENHLKFKSTTYLNALGCSTVISFATTNN